jgi:hypothetical protein
MVDSRLADSDHDSVASSDDISICSLLEVLPEKEAYLEILDQALEPDSPLTALKQRSIPEVTMIVFEHIVDQHFAVMSRRTKDLATWTGYLQGVVAPSCAVGDELASSA